MVEAATFAREAGASVLALTRSDTPLSRVASLTLPVNVDENTDLYIPMVSRLDAVAGSGCFGYRRRTKTGSDFQPHLARIKKAIDGTRLSD